MNDTQIKKYYIQKLQKRIDTFKNMNENIPVKSNEEAIKIIKLKRTSIDMARSIFELQETTNELAYTIYTLKYELSN